MKIARGESIKVLHNKFKNIYKHEEFETVFAWCDKWILIEKSDKSVRLWCLTIWVELFTTVQRYLHWMQGVKEGRTSGDEILDRAWVLNHYDGLWKSSKFRQVQVVDPSLVALRPRALVKQRVAKLVSSILSVDNDDDVYIPDETTFEEYNVPYPTDSGDSGDATATDIIPATQDSVIDPDLTQ
ncbi:unnamed protein product [Clonostachys rhizophaga]|uniref:Uncharacterized protein n=1 Tax=Clonostachys rhizophaga TaxID=160324 RepID=A0A9N9YUX4_9HYPO|nr:unnamed protein product [Clonostachys rhizophaga]